MMIIQSMTIVLLWNLVQPATQRDHCDQPASCRHDQRAQCPSRSWSAFQDHALRRNQALCRWTHWWRVRFRRAGRTLRGPLSGDSFFNTVEKLSCCSSTIHQRFINDSPMIHQRFMNDSSTIHQRFINDSSMIHERFINDS